MALAGINYLAALVRVLPERDPHEAVYRAASLIAEALDDSALAPTLVARFEAQILAECGFRLDLGSCAATGVTDDLAYVSPKSGRAVSAEAGAPWRDRLLPLPPFLREGAPLEAQPSAEEIADGFRLTGFFLARDLFSLRGEPLAGLAGRLSQGGAGSAIAGAASRSRPRGQANPSQSKPDQIRPSKIAWFYLVLFVRIGTFQWVTANPNKNLVPHVTLCLECHNAFSLLSSLRDDGHGFNPANAKV